MVEPTIPEQVPKPARPPGPVTAPGTRVLAIRGSTGESFHPPAAAAARTHDDPSASGSVRRLAARSDAAAVEPVRGPPRDVSDIKPEASSEVNVRGTSRPVEGAQHPGATVFDRGGTGP